MYEQQLSHLFPWNRWKRLSTNVRLCLSADLENFSRFRRVEATSAQNRLIEALRRARRHAGIREEHTALQPSGDGEFAILPPGLNGPVAIPKLAEGLWMALREINQDLSDHARIRLRVAMYQGHVSPGHSGWCGYATTAVHRLLDSPAARTSLDENSKADFVFLVGTDIYRDYISDDQGWLSPEQFNRVTVDMPAKGFHETAWIFIPPL
jgi:hypothetical protein